MFEKPCSMLDVVFDYLCVVFEFGCCVHCCVRMVLCSHIVVFDFETLLCSLFCSSPGCSVRCSVRNQCCGGFSVRIRDVVFDVLFALEMLCSMFCSHEKCCVRCFVRRGSTSVDVVFVALFAVACCVRCCVRTYLFCSMFCSHMADLFDVVFAAICSV